MLLHTDIYETVVPTVWSLGFCLLKSIFYSFITSYGGVDM